VKGPLTGSTQPRGGLAHGGMQRAHQDLQPWIRGLLAAQQVQQAADQRVVPGQGRLPSARRNAPKVLGTQGLQAQRIQEGLAEFRVGGALQALQLLAQDSEKGVSGRQVVGPVARRRWGVEPTPAWRRRRPCRQHRPGRGRGRVGWFGLWHRHRGGDSRPASRRGGGCRACGGLAPRPAGWRGSRSVLEGGVFPRGRDLLGTPHEPREDLPEDLPGFSFHERHKPRRGLAGVP